MRSLDKRVNHFKQTNEIIWFKGNFGKLEIKSKIRDLSLQIEEITYEKERKEKREKRKGRKEKGEEKG